MGAWGSAAFENDVAEDWIGCLLDETDLFLVADALSAVLDDADVSEADRCFEAVAAAEVVAASRGRFSRDLPEEIRDWLEETEVCADDDLAAKAIAAVTVVRDHSEATLLWDGSPDWKRGLNGLLRRLRSEVKVRRTATRGPELPPEVAEIVRQLRKHRADIIFEKGEIHTIGLDALKGCDADIDLILRLPHAPYVFIGSCDDVTTTGLCRLSESESLEKLVLTHMPTVTDDVLKALSTSPKLRELEVTSTPITDAGVAHLHSLEDLQEFDANYTQVSGEALVALQQRFPGCEIRPVKLLRSAGGKIPKRTSRPFLWEGRWTPPT